MNKVYKINNNVFWFDVIYLDMSESDAIEWIIKNRPDYEIPDLKDWLTYIDWAEVIIHLSDVSDYVLLHECIHAIQWVLYRKWIDTSYDNTEVLAYNVDWLFRQILLRHHKSRWNEKWKTYR